MRFEHDAESPLADSFEQKHVAPIDFPIVAQLKGIKRGIRRALLFATDVGGTQNSQDEDNGRADD